MANYTIERNLTGMHPNTVFGCDNYSTLQEEGQVASNINGTILYGTVIWDLKASIGYEVSIDDFIFSNAVMISSNPNQTIWNNLQSPILGARMVKISTTHIRIYLHLMPNANYPGFNPGAPFQMPTNDVNITVAIEGCARLKGQGQHLRIAKPTDENTMTRIDIDSDLTKEIAGSTVGSDTDVITGTLPPTEVSDKPRRKTLLASYQVTAKDGYRYIVEPNLTFTDKNYFVKKRVTKEVNAIDPAKKDVVSVSFDIYKK